MVVLRVAWWQFVRVIEAASAWRGTGVVPGAHGLPLLRHAPLTRGKRAVVSLLLPAKFASRW